MSTVINETPPLSQPAGPPPEQASSGVAHNLLARSIAALALSMSVLAGFASLTGVIEGHAWFPALVIPVIAIHLCAGLLRGIWGLRFLALPVALLIGFMALMQHEAMRATGYSVTGFQWFMAVLSEAVLQFSTQVPPVAYSRYAAFAILLLALFISLLVEVLITFKKLALLVIIPLSLAPVVASLFKQEGAGIGYLALVVAGILVFTALVPFLYRGAAPKHHPRFPSRKQLGFLSASAFACIAALLAASFWMPGFRHGMFPEGQRPSGDLLASNVDPLLNLGRDLRSNSGATILSYYTSSKKAPYLRTAVIGDLSTPRWEPTDSLDHDAYSGDTMMENSFTSFNATEQVAVLDYSGGIKSAILPLPNRSNFVQGIVGDWNWTRETSVARLSGEAIAQTKSISVSYAELDLSPQIAKSLEFYGGIPDDMPGPVYRQLPEDPEQTLKTALDQALKEAYAEADDPRSDLEKATAIQDYLRSSKFLYSERTPLREGYDGANKRVVESFLERKQGYCVHFSAAMALMAREAGIPSRIAIGYSPGTANGKTMKADDNALNGNLNMSLEPDSKLTGYSVSGKNSHSWPELYLGALGWIPFEPTPGQGQVPSYAPEETKKPEAAAPTVNEVPTTRATPRLPESDSAPAEDEPAAAQQDASGASSFWWPAAGVLAAAGTVLSIAPLRRRRLWQQRRDESSGGEQLAASLWLELQAVGADTFNPAQPNETVSSFTQRLAQKYGQCAQDLEFLGQAIQDSFYAARHPSAQQSQQLRHSLERINHRLHQELPMGQRLGAALFPASLRQAKLRTVPGRERTRV